MVITLGSAALAEAISVRHVQRPIHWFMVARSEAGAIIANCEFSQVVPCDESDHAPDLSLCRWVD